MLESSSGRKMVRAAIGRADRLLFPDSVRVENLRDVPDFLVDAVDRQRARIAAVLVLLAEQEASAPSVLGADVGPPVTEPRSLVLVGPHGPPAAPLADPHSRRPAA